MPTLGTQNIATSYPQLLKTFTVGGLDGSAQVITDGDNTSSALSLSTSEVQSTGSFTVSSNSRLLGPVTFGTSITASTGTATIGTLLVTSETATNSTISNRITAGTVRIGASGPSVTFMSHGTASFPSTVVGPYNASGTATGTFTVTGAQLGDFVCGSINSIGSATGAAGFYAVPSFYVVSADTVRYSIAGPSSQGTIGAGIVSATAWRVIP